MYPQQSITPLPFSNSEFRSSNPELDVKWEEGVNRNSPDYVRWVQQSLNQVMGLRLAVDGIAGPATRSAIRSFQQKQGLVADGVVAGQTEAALKAALARGADSGAPSPPDRCEVLDRFGFDSDSLTATHHAQIDVIARGIVGSQNTNRPVRGVHLIGHTDPVGSDAYNLQLGKRRARAVGRQLSRVLEGLRPGILSVFAVSHESRGEREQISTDAAQNRRVQVCLIRASVPTPPPHPPPQPPPGKTPPIQVIPRWVQILGGDQTRPGNRVTYLVDGQETFRAIAGAIRMAKRPGDYIYLLGWWLDDDLPLIGNYPPLPNGNPPPVQDDPTRPCAHSCR